MLERPVISVTVKDHCGGQALTDHTLYCKCQMEYGLELELVTGHLSRAELSMPELEPLAREPTGL